MSLESAAMSGELERALKDLWQTGAETPSTDQHKCFGNAITEPKTTEGGRQFADAANCLHVKCAEGSHLNEVEANSGMLGKARSSEMSDFGLEAGRCAGSPDDEDVGMPFGPGGERPLAELGAEAARISVRDTLVSVARADRPASANTIERLRLQARDALCRGVRSGRSQVLKTEVPSKERSQHSAPDQPRTLSPADRTVATPCVFDYVCRLVDGALTGKAECFRIPTACSHSDGPQASRVDLCSHQPLKRVLCPRSVPKCEASTLSCLPAPSTAQIFAAPVEDCRPCLDAVVEYMLKTDAPRCAEEHILRPASRNKRCPHNRGASDERGRGLPSDALSGGPTPSSNCSQGDVACDTRVECPSLPAPATRSRRPRRAKGSLADLVNGGNLHRSAGVEHMEDVPSGRRSARGSGRHPSSPPTLSSTVKDIDMVQTSRSKKTTAMALDLDGATVGFTTSKFRASSLDHRKEDSSSDVLPTLCSAGKSAEAIAWSVGMSKASSKWRVGLGSVPVSEASRWQV